MITMILGLNVLIYSQWMPDYKLTAISYYTYNLQNNTKQVASIGNIVHAVWYDNRDGNSEIYYKRSSDAGASWGADTRLTNAASNSEEPGIIAVSNFIHVAWNDLRDGDWGIYYKRSSDGGLNWSADQRLSDQPSNAFYPAMAGNGNLLHLVWMDSRNGSTQNGYETYYKRSTDAGITWGEDIRLTNNTTNTLYPSISVSSQYVHIVWYDTPVSQQATYYMRSTNEGLTFNSEIRLSSTAGASNWPCISASGEFVHVVWLDTRDGNYEIYYKRSSDSGTNWGTDTRLTNTVPNSWYPSIETSGRILHVVWWDQLNIPTGNSQIYYKRSTDAGTNWEPDIRITNDDNYSKYTSVAVSDQSVHVVWCDWRDGIGIWYKRNPTGNLVPPSAPPMLISPLNNLLHQSLTPLLNWDTVDYAINFRVQVSFDSLFGNSVFDSVIPVSQVIIPAGKLINDRKYFWKVRGSNVLGEGPWSAIWNFTTVIAPPILAPVLVTPLNNSGGQSLTPLLDWDTVINSDLYQSQVSTESLFVAIVFDTAIALSDINIPAGKLSNNVKYFWRVRAVNSGGNGPWSITWNFTTALVGILQIGNLIPKENKLHANYPNPFNPVTTFRFDLSGPSVTHTSLSVYDILGREVSNLVNSKLQPGTYEFQWDASNYPSGVYFYRLTAGNFTAVNKMILLK